MKVKELIAKLSKENQDLDVVCYTEDPKLLGSNPGFLLFEIQTIDEMSGERTRGKDGATGFKIDDGGPTTVIILDVTTDF